MLEKAPLTKQIFKVLMHIILAVICCGAVFAFVKLVVLKLLVMPLLTSLFAVSEIQTHALNGIGTVLGFGLGYFLFVKYYEKRKAEELSLDGKNMLIGITAGAVIVSITSLLLFAIGYYQIISYQPINEIAYAFIGLSAQGIASAVLFIGFFFRIIEKHLGTKYTIICLSIAFGCLNILVDGTNVLVLISVALVNALWISIYVLTRNIWVAGLANGAWLCAVFMTGLLDEHWRTSAPFISSIQGPDLITGGVFGPEHSIITIITLSVSLFLIATSIQNKKRGQDLAYNPKKNQDKAQQLGQS